MKLRILIERTKMMLVEKQRKKSHECKKTKHSGKYIVKRGDEKHYKTVFFNFFYYGHRH